jgi:hypothetical protein
LHRARRVGSVGPGKASFRGEFGPKGGFFGFDFRGRSFVLKEFSGSFGEICFFAPADALGSNGDEPAEGAVLDPGERQLDAMNAIENASAVGQAAEGECEEPGMIFTDVQRCNAPEFVFEDGSFEIYDVALAPVAKSERFSELVLAWRLRLDFVFERSEEGAPCGVGVMVGERVAGVESVSAAVAR